MPLTSGSTSYACDLSDMRDDSRRNAILLCDGVGCKVALHQHCCGVAEIPEGDWLCDGCAAGVPSEAHMCLLCPVSGGALRRVGGTGPVKLPPGGLPFPPPVLCLVPAALWSGAPMQEEQVVLM